MDITWPSVMPACSSPAICAWIWLWMVQFITSSYKIQCTPKQTTACAKQNTAGSIGMTQKQVHSEHPQDSQTRPEDPPLLQHESESSESRTRTSPKNGATSGGTAHLQAAGSKLLTPRKQRCDLHRETEPVMSTPACAAPSVGGVACTHKPQTACSAAQHT